MVATNSKYIFSLAIFYKQHLGLPGQFMRSNNNSNNIYYVIYYEYLLCVSH